MATNYANIFRIDPSKNNQDFAGDSNTLAYFLTGRQQDNKGLPPLITGISGNQIIVEYSDTQDISLIDVSWNISNTGNVLDISFVDISGGNLIINYSNDVSNNIDISNQILNISEYDISGTDLIIPYYNDASNVTIDISNVLVNNIIVADGRNIINLSSNRLITGTISDGIQRLGIGQAQAMRLYNHNSNSFIDLTINELKDKIRLFIDASNNVLIKTPNNSDTYNGMTLWSVIFNVYDSFGIPFQAEKDISLNFYNILNHSFDNNINYDISLNSSCFILYENTLNQNSPTKIPQHRITTNPALLDDNRNYLIDISNNNELYIYTNSTASYESPFYLKELKFYLIDNYGNYINSYDIYFELEWHLYDISYSSSKLFKIIYYSDMFNSSDISNIIDINPLYSSNNPIKIGTFKTTGYSFFPDLSLNYYNINAVTDNSNFLITLDTTPQLIGQLTF